MEYANLQINLETLEATWDIVDNGDIIVPQLSIVGEVVQDEAKLKAEIEQVIKSLEVNE